MPFIYDPRLKGSGYRDTDTGRIMSYATLREQVNIMITESNDVALTLSALVKEGNISLNDWYAAMRQEIKDNYITQYLAGRGGLERMTYSDWGSVGGMIKEQYGYLSNFYNDIATQDLSVGEIYNRARMYLNSSREAFSRASYREAVDRGYMMHKWVRNPSKENCEDCTILEDMGAIDILTPFMSPSKGVPCIPGSGDTLCLTSCQCHEEFL